MQSLNADTESTIACDVLVAGGGVAGVAAAVSAARQGVTVILTEKNEVLGGIGVRGMLGTLCGLYSNNGTEPPETLNAGIAREMTDVLKRSSLSRVQKIGKVFVLRHASADLGKALGALCSNESTLTVMLNTEVLSAAHEQGTVSEVVIARQQGRQKALPKVVVDASGNGNLSCLAGAAYELAGPDDIQMAGYTVRLNGIEPGDEGLQIKIPTVLAGAVRNNELTPTLRFTTYRPGDVPGEGYLKFNVEDTRDAGREPRVRESVLKAVEILARRLSAFSNATIVEISPVLRREGRRILGEYVLIGEDVTAGRKFSDGVVRNSWPIELWDRIKGTVYEYPPDGDYYEIPFRCLKVKNFRNLLAAGRCISVSHEAYGSVRVMGSCIALGDVAGRAAAEFAKTGKYPDFHREES